MVTLDVIEAERAIVRLLHDYGYHIDYGEPDLWLALFAPDARYVLRYRDGLTPRSIGMPAREGSDLVYKGKALADFIAAHSHAPDKYHKHFVTGWRIDIADAAASSMSYFQRVDASEGGARIVAAGRYRDRFVRSSCGRWLFSERIAEIEIQ